MHTRRFAVPALLGLITVVALSLTALARQAPKVDDARLRAPGTGEWVSYGRDYAETHHSPLTQIDQATVSRLAPVWSVEVGSAGKIETTPIVANGVMYISTKNQLFAIEAAAAK